MNYCCDDRFRIPCMKESDIDNYLVGGDFGLFYRNLETQKTVREKVLNQFAKMKEDFTAPCMGALSVIATKP